MRTPEQVAHTFWANVLKTDSCWVWTGMKNRGYGRFKVNNVAKYAHRYAYEQLVQEIPEGLFLDHLCRNTACVNPAHLEAVPHRVNVLRGTGPTSANAQKQSCHLGHPFTEENTTINRQGSRVCKTCQRIKSKEKRQRQLQRQTGAFGCQFCSAAFRNERGLRTHTSKMHRGCDGP